MVQIREPTVQCPICEKQFSVRDIEEHVNQCIGGGGGGAQLEGDSGFPAVPEPAKKKPASPASKNLQQWSELQMHQLDSLVSDLSTLKLVQLETLEKALEGHVSRIRAARQASAARGAG